MFLGLSPTVSVKKEDIIGIFDMDYATSRPDSRSFLRAKERAGKLTTTANDIPKSFVVTDNLTYLVRSAPSSLKTHL